MTDLFEEIFWMVGEEHNTFVWYEIFDSSMFTEVIERICERLNISQDELEDMDEFDDWYGEMAEDL